MDGLPHETRLTVRALGLAAAAMLAAITTTASSTMVNVAIPGLMRHFGASALSAQFVMTAFLVAMTLTMPLAGWMTQRWGVRAVMLHALVAFAAASLAAALAGGLAGVIAARVLQGAAAGVIQPASLAALYLAFPRRMRGTAVGLHALAIVLAPAIGPWLGGLAVEAAGWRAIFSGAIPIALASAAASAVLVPATAAKVARKVRFDATGFAWLTLLFACFMASAWEAARPGGAIAMAIILATAGIGATAVFVRRQVSSPDPLVELRLLAAPEFRAAGIVGFLLSAGLYGSTLMVPLLAQFVLGLGPGMSGFLLLPAGMVLVALSPVAGWLGNRLALAPLVAAGLATVALSNLAFLTVDRQSPILVIVVLLGVGRAGLAFASPLTNLAALRAAPDRDAAHAAGLIGFARQLGGIAGVMGFSALVGPAISPAGAHLRPDALIAAFHEAFVIAAALYFGGLLGIRGFGRERASPGIGAKGLPPGLAGSFEEFPLADPPDGAGPEAPGEPGSVARKSR